MDIVNAYQQVGTYRGAAELCGTTHKTVKRVIERLEAGQVGEERPVRAPRDANYEDVRDVVTQAVRVTRGRVSAKRLLPRVRAAGYAGSDRNFRRLVAEEKRVPTGGQFAPRVQAEPDSLPSTDTTTDTAPGPSPGPRARVRDGLNAFAGRDPDDGSLPPEIVAEAVLVRFTPEEQRQFALDWIRSRYDEGGFVAGAWAQQAADRDLDAEALRAEAGEPGSSQEAQWLTNRVEAIAYMLDETGQAGSPHMLPVMRAGFAHLSHDRFDESVTPLVREAAKDANLPVGYVESRLEPLLREELSARRAAANG